MNKWNYVTRPREQKEEFTFDGPILMTAGIQNEVHVMDVVHMISTIRMMVQMGLKLDGIQTFQHVDNPKDTVWVHQLASKEHIEQATIGGASEEELDLLSTVTIMFPHEY